jgi:proteic killer suppression protein
VRIRNFVHKGLSRLYADDDPKGIPPDSADKLRKMLAFLQDMNEPDELRSLPIWRAHTLTGDRLGNLRIDTAEPETCDVNLEDYH